MKPKRGRLIVLEGGEGAGKSTWAVFIRAWLEKNRRHVVSTREPGGTPCAEAIRTILLEGRNNMPAVTELLLMFAARVDHVNRLILPALQSGRDVVCDRFGDSSYAYQGAGRGLPRPWLESLEKMTLGKLKPELVLLFDWPPAVGMARVRRRGRKDRFEKEPLAFQQRIRREFLRRARLAPQRYAVIDAACSQPEVQKQLLKILEQRL